LWCFGLWQHAISYMVTNVSLGTQRDHLHGRSHLFTEGGSSRFLRNTGNHHQANSVMTQKTRI
jgi:hypothetical protein